MGCFLVFLVLFYRKSPHFNSSLSLLFYATVGCIASQQNTNHLEQSFLTTWYANPRNGKNKRYWNPSAPGETCSKKNMHGILPLFSHVYKWNNFRANWDPGNPVRPSLDSYLNRNNAVAHWRPFRRVYSHLTNIWSPNTAGTRLTVRMRALGIRERCGEAEISPQCKYVPRDDCSVSIFLQFGLSKLWQNSQVAAASWEYIQYVCRICVYTN